jgi:hypothetical protein
MENLVFLYLSMEMLSVALGEQLLILVGKSTVLYKTYDAKREYNSNLLLVFSR